MRLFWWRHREPEASGVSIDDVCHHSRNAVSGIEYERKQIFRALAEIARSLNRIQEHMERIEGALRNAG